MSQGRRLIVLADFNDDDDYDGDLAGDNVSTTVTAPGDPGALASADARDR